MLKVVDQYNRIKNTESKLKRAVNPTGNTETWFREIQESKFRSKGSKFFSPYSFERTLCTDLQIDDNDSFIEKTEKTKRHYQWLILSRLG